MAMQRCAKTWSGVRRLSRIVRIVSNPASICVTECKVFWRSNIWKNGCLPLAQDKLFRCHSRSLSLTTWESFSNLQRWFFDGRLGIYVAGTFSESRDRNSLTYFSRMEAYQPRTGVGRSMSSLFKQLIVCMSVSLKIYNFKYWTYDYWMDEWYWPGTRGCMVSPAQDASGPPVDGCFAISSTTARSTTTAQEATMTDTKPSLSWSRWNRLQARAASCHATAAWTSSKS